MMTRSVRGQLFLLRPCESTNRLIKYVVGVMSDTWNIRIHAITAMSNHWHVCLTDPDGAIVEFQRDCHHFIASALNTQNGEDENVWSSAPTSRVECVESGDLLSKLAYTMANPVEARLVRHGHDWPGVRCAWPRKPEVVQRPAIFFRGEDQGGAWPDVAVLAMSRPPGFEGMSDEELKKMIEQAIEAREASFRKSYDDDKRPFLGRRDVRKQSRHARPKDRRDHFGISPKLACRNKWRRIERINANKCWLAAYRAALAAWCAGLRNVVFPAGTYLMRVRHGVAVAHARGPD